MIFILMQKKPPQAPAVEWREPEGAHICCIMAICRTLYCEPMAVARLKSRYTTTMTQHGGPGR